MRPGDEVGVITTDETGEAYNTRHCIESVSQRGSKHLVMLWCMNQFTVHNVVAPDLELPLCPECLRQVLEAEKEVAS